MSIWEVIQDGPVTQMCKNMEETMAKFVFFVLF